MRLKLLIEMIKLNWKYLFVELFLITLGVLIALAIGNWSEKRENRRKEAFHLEDLRESLRSDLAELQQIIESHRRYRWYCDTLFQHLKAHKPWDDSTAFWVGNCSGSTAFFPQRAAFENLKSLDFNLVQSDLIRASIFRLYEERFEQHKTSEQILMRRVEDKWIPLMDSKVLLVDDFQLKPVDYAAMQQDPRYMNYIALIWADHERIIAHATLSCIDIEILMRQIDLELGKIRSGRKRTQTPRVQRIALEGFSDARTVTIAGTFNEWNPASDTMRQSPGGWAIDLRLKPGVYMYKFIVDSAWMEDPANPSRIMSEFGNYNSILEVK